MASADNSPATSKPLRVDSEGGRRSRLAEADRRDVSPLPPKMALRATTKAVALAGGWTDVATMERCYDLPDDADVLAVTSETHKRRESVPQVA